MRGAMFVLVGSSVVGCGILILAPASREEGRQGDGQEGE
jgi:hypothetical protein